ncbi:MAG: homocysteine S-methyltransferase family protein, partial [Oscillospiraceae bacterium]|nr:homocysteine S-methyltransferase family protein [Oscillospiraceae bacterium]
MKLPLLLDGATGTRLMAAGMPPDVCPEQWILDNPDSLISIQQGYVDAGCDVLYVPSFGANRVCLNKYGLGDRVVEMNKRLAALTKGVIADNPGRKVLVAGDMSPTGLLPLPWGDTPFEDYEKIYCEQATALYEAGVDLIVCETMTNLTEARAALSAARKTGLPVFVTVTVDKNGRTLSGGRLLPFVITLQSMGAAAVGLNCSNGVSFMAGQLSEALPHAKVPLVAKPNAMDEQGELDPIRFSLEVQKLLDAGATIVGGCCGTSDKHIAALRRILDSHPIIAPAQINANACAV